MASQAAITVPSLAENNEYLASSNVTSLEAEVLGEYARLANNLEKLTTLANKLTATQPELMQTLVPLEKKLGLVLTLFKASVWATYVAQESRQEQQEQEDMQRQQQFQQHHAHF